MQQAFTKYITHKPIRVYPAGDCGTSYTQFVTVVVVLIKTVQGLVHVFGYGGSCRMCYRVTYM